MVRLLGIVPGSLEDGEVLCWLSGTLAVSVLVTLGVGAAGLLGRCSLREGSGSP